METATYPNCNGRLETVPDDPYSPEWLKRADAAALCSLAPSTFDRHARDHGLARAERRGNHGHVEHVFRRADVLQMLKAIRSIRPIPPDRTELSEAVLVLPESSHSIPDRPAPSEPEASHSGRNRPNAEALLHGAQIAAKLQAIRAKEARGERDRMKEERDQLVAQIDFLKEQLHNTQLIVAKQVQMLETASKPAALPAHDDTPAPTPKKARWWLWRRRG
jgi:hypothetical protein